MDTPIEELAERRAVIWGRAQNLVQPLVEAHEVQKVVIGGIFQTNDVISPLDQHINSIIRVADWLLKENQY